MSLNTLFYLLRYISDKVMLLAEVIEEIYDIITKDEPEAEVCSRVRDCGFSFNMLSFP